MSVSVDTWCAIARVLGKRFGDRFLTQEAMNELIRLSGEIERLYQACEKVPKEKRAKRTESAT